MGEELRRQVRVSKILLVRIQKGFIQFFGNIVDLAKNGVGLACQRELDMSDELKLAINVPNRKTMDLEGAIVWKLELPRFSKNRFQYGVRLRDPGEEYLEYVDGLVRREYERRAHHRFAMLLEVSNDDVLDLLDAAAQDVSAGGLYIRTGTCLPIGSEYEISLKGAGLDYPLECLVEVVASFETDADDLDHPYGAGVKILSFKADGEKRFAEYLRQLDALYQFHWPEDLPEAPTESEIDIEAE